MIELSIQEIKNITNSHFYSRGAEYYINNKVKFFRYGYLSHENNFIRISANVEGSNGNIYSALADLNNEEGITNVYCDCMAFKNYNIPCKHIVALLLYYSNNISKIKDNFNDEKINSLINTLKDNNISNSIKKEINIYFKLYVDFINKKPSYYAELKTGKNQLYIVKNIIDFFRAVKYGGELEFGKNFTYNSNKHKLKENDKKIFDILYQASETIEINNINNFNNSISLLKGKKIFLTQSQFMLIINLLKGKKFELHIAYRTIKDPEIIISDMPLEFDIKYKNKNIVIYQSDLPLNLTCDGSIFWYDDKIYIPSQKQINTYLPFYKIFNSDDNITLSENSLDALGEYILPAVKKISSELKIENTIKEKIINEPLNSEIYLDKKDDTISAYISFQYKDIKINPLHTRENHSKNILLRDNVHENQITDILSTYGFIKSQVDYILNDEEQIIEFLYSGIDKLQKLSSIYYSDSFKALKICSSCSINSSLRINDNDLLEFSFDIDGINKNEIKTILNSIKTKKKYYRLKNGSFVLLNSQGFKNLAETIDYLNINYSDLNNDKLILPKFNSIYMNDKLKNNEYMTVEKNFKFKNTINSFNHINESDFKAPAHIDKILRAYQKTGFKWFKTLEQCGFGGILADEMGLGKTLQAIAFISSLKNNDTCVNKSLIICPTSLIYNWESEIKKFAPEIKTIVISGKKDERIKKINDIKNYDAVITSYPLLRIDIEEYENTLFYLCLIDEAQYIKNPQSQNAQCIKKLKAKVHFALTGTPIENSLMELWSIFDFIMPGYLLNRSKFSKLYEAPIIKSSDKNALDELNKHVKPFILRRCKKDVVKELPPKIEHKILIDLNEKQKKLYASYVLNYKEELNKEIIENGFNKSKIKILSLLTRLRQLCCDPSIFIENYKGESAKMTALMDIIDDCINNNHRILIFSQFTSILKNISAKLHKKSIRYMYLDGSTKSEQRIDMVNSFNNGECSIFLISLKAGGTGLNLTGADTVIHFDPWWNPAVEEQASDRAHRIGQQKTVEIIKLITKGTIEERIYELQAKKKDMFDSVLNNSSQNNLLSSMSESEIKSLFELK